MAARTRTSWRGRWIGRRTRGTESKRRPEKEDWSPWLKTSHSDKNLPAINWYDSGTRCRCVRSRSAPAVTVRPCISRDIFLWRRSVDDSFVSSLPSLHRLVRFLSTSAKKKMKRANVPEGADKEGTTLAPRRNVPQILTGTVVPGKACREASCRKSPGCGAPCFTARKLSLRGRELRPVQGSTCLSGVCISDAEPFSTLLVDAHTHVVM